MSIWKAFFYAAIMGITLIVFFGHGLPTLMHAKRMGNPPYAGFEVRVTDQQR